MEEDFTKNFIDVFLEHSYNNHLFAFMSLHLILGRCLWKVKIPKKRLWLDGRISFWYLAPPSSGKSTPYDFISEILTSLENNEGIHDVDDASDAVLIGYDNEDGDRVKGILDRGGVVHWDEAAMLLGTTQYAEKTKAFLQKCLNPVGSGTNTCTREFKNTVVSIDPYCSLYLTSYIPDKILEVVLGTGMLQRLLCVPKDVTTEDRKKNAYTDIDYLGTVSGGEDLGVEYFIERFKKINDKYNKEDTVFDWSEVKPFFKGKSDNILNISKDSPNRVRKLMETFHPRYMDSMYILSMHHCCLRNDNIINSDDVEYAYRIISGCYTAILAWLEDEPTFNQSKKKDQEYFKNVKTLFKNEKKIGSTTFFKKCCKMWNISEPIARKRVLALVERAKQGEEGLRKEKTGRAVFFRLQKR
ncbi:MAG: hypothetical protein KAS07_05980 [Candidatus Pacebacteria bacterium]|nr:hypothetical protein [Candidatus Paceibacterota bacterium]